MSSLLTPCVRDDHACLQTRQQSICVRHEDVVDNTTTWLVDFQEQFGLATKPGFPIEVLHITGILSVATSDPRPVPGHPMTIIYGLPGSCHHMAAGPL